MDVSTITLSDAAIDEIARRVVLLLQRGREKELLTAIEAAAYLHCGKRRLYDLRYRGVLEGVQEGGRLLFARAELDRHLGR
jgi:excisionase family DNA binding protein